MTTTKWNTQFGAMDKVTPMSSWWWVALLIAGAVIATSGFALGSPARHSALSATLLLCAVGVLTAGILGLVL